MYSNKGLKVILIGILLVGLISGVQGVAPTASFTSNVTQVLAGGGVGFIDTSTGSPTGWGWFFGDETYTQPWTQVNASSSWRGRYHHSMVALPDGSYVIMGGRAEESSTVVFGDVWRTTDNGVHWTLMNASAWTPRYLASAVALSDNSIIVMGGQPLSGSTFKEAWRSTNVGATWTLVNSSIWSAGRYAAAADALPDDTIVITGGRSGSTYLNDTWKSTDKGSTWTQPNTSSGWSTRVYHTLTASPDGNLTLTGGFYYGTGENYYNDVWRSTDKGSYWTLINASAAWPTLCYHSIVSFPDNSLILTNGYHPGTGGTTDVWRSIDGGKIWAQINTSAWSARQMAKSARSPDGSIVTAGGRLAGGDTNGTWLFQPQGSNLQNPSHMFTGAVGKTFNVSMTAFNTGGANLTIQPNYITIIDVIAPIAKFIKNWGSNTVPVPRTVIFNDTSLNTPTSWNWTCGDIPPSYQTSQNVSCRFVLRGWRNVTLVATNVAGSSTNYTMMHTV